MVTVLMPFNVQLQRLNMPKPPGNNSNDGKVTSLCAVPKGVVGASATSPVNPAVGATDLAALLAELLTDLPVFVCVLNANNGVVYMNNRVASFEGVHLNPLAFNVAVSRNRQPPSDNAIEIFEDIFPRGFSERIHALEAVDKYEAAPGIDLTIRHKDRSNHAYHIIKLRREVEPSTYWTLLIGVDVTAHKLAENSLKDHKSRLDYMVYHDPLTGLANRSLFYDRIE